MGPTQITRLSGLAADGVARIELFLASGRVIPAALRDNAYAVEAPTSQFPAKLVAYDARGRVLSIEMLPGLARPAPCPEPSFPRREPAPDRPFERLDLATGRVNGQRVLGRGPAEVRAALGRPDRVAYFSRTNGVREPTFFYGGTLPGSSPLIVTFKRRKGRIEATTLAFAGPRIVEARLGRVLRLPPLELQRRLRAAYGRRYELDLPYGSDPSRGCVAVLRTPSRNAELTIGISPYRPSRPFLVLGRG
jgi:hypothetical protein